MSLKGVALEFEWKHSLESVRWEELSNLYRVAPLGDKKPRDLDTAFSNSMFKCFVFDSGELVGAGRALADGVDCSYLCDIAVLPTHQGLGIGRGIASRLGAPSRRHQKNLLEAAPWKQTF